MISGKINITLYIILFSANLLFPFNGLFAQDCRKDNSKCLNCHSKPNIVLTDSITGKKVEHTYPKGFVIDTGSYYHSSHKTVSCVKCHSEGYQKYPHPADLKNKPMPSCMDCHKENYDSYTKINFDAIDSAYRKSVHAVNLKEKFSCDYCHSQHYLKIGTVGAKDVEAIVDYDNKICLKCHDNAERYNRFVTSPMPDLAETHKWLPNFEFHLSAIRCIECHTAHSSGIDAQPTLPFSLHNKQRNEHFIMHNNSSQHSCVECHSGSPVVLQSLYKFKSKTENKDGFLNAPLIKNAFVIGANRNICLDIASIIIFVVLLCFILVHLWYRYRTKKHLIKPRQRVHSPPLLLLHWLNTIVFGLLVITGISMHYSGKKFQLIQFSTAVSVHTMCAIIFIFSSIVYLMVTIKNRKWKIYMLRKFVIKKSIIQLKHTLPAMFKKQAHSVEKQKRFKPIYWLSLEVIFILLPLLFITGLGLMYPEYVFKQVFGISGLFLIDLIHICVAFAITMFMAVHIYMTTISRKHFSNLKAMIKAWKN